MKKRKSFLYLVLTILGVFILLIVGLNNAFKNNRLIHGEPKPYSITLNTNTNKLVTESNFVSGSGEVKTGLNNPISVDYTNVSNGLSVWQVIKINGSFENIDPISGLTSMSITKANNDAHIGVYWSSVHSFDEEHYVEFDTSSTLEVTTYFDNYHPNYFKVVALGVYDASITNITIEFSCLDIHHLEVGNNYEMGTYPQSKVTNTKLITTLNDEAGDLPTSLDSQSWTSYNYYISSSNTTDFMWYQDVSLENEQYRVVYFTSYRPILTTSSSSTGNSYQDDNGYTTNTMYWFKYEPIVWKVLSTSEVEGPLLLSNKILDSQEYYHLTSTRLNGDETIYPSNYKESNVRTWLNDNFYNFAFKANEKSLIAITNVDNSVYSTGDASNTYVCENTNDKLFLLSYRDATNTTYGFNNNASRIRQATDYAKAMGILLTNENSSWRLRSPNNTYNYQTRHISNTGGYITLNNVYNTDFGILPAFRINR